MSGPLAALALASAVAGAWDANEEGAFGKYQNLKNAKMALDASEDAVSRGKLDVVRTGVAAKSMIGSQRAAMAAQGVDIGVGSAVDVQADTMAAAEIQKLMIKNNAAREAWGFIVQAGDYEMNAKMSARAGANRARTSLLSGGFNAYRAYKS